MASIITATTTSGLTQSADNSGVLQLASGTGNLVTVPSTTGTMALTASPTFTGTATIPTATVTTLNTPSGVFATQNGMTGIPKAWLNYKGTSTQSIRDSFNVSSVTRNGTGDYTVNFTTAMPNANYSVQVMGNLNLSGNYGYLFAAPYNTAPTTSAVRIATSNTSVLLDMDYVFVSIFSS